MIPIDDDAEANKATLVPPLVLPGGVLLEDANPDLFQEYYGKGGNDEDH